MDAGWIHLVQDGFQLQAIEYGKEYSGSIKGGEFCE
jgi:hypothetical protein